MGGKSCFFVGHRDAPAQIRMALEKEIERHITQCGVTAFFTGGYGSCASPLRDCKSEPHDGRSGGLFDLLCALCGQQCTKFAGLCAKKNKRSAARHHKYR